MKALRMLLSVLSVGLLALGYAASQRAFFNGSFAEYAQWVDRPPVRTLALILLLGSIAMAFIRDSEATRGEP